MAVVGIDDVYAASVSDPPLTTVGQPVQMLGKQACARLLDRIADPALPPTLDLFPLSWCSARVAVVRPHPPASEHPPRRAACLSPVPTDAAHQLPCSAWEPWTNDLATPQIHLKAPQLAVPGLMAIPQVRQDRDAGRDRFPS